MAPLPKRRHSTARQGKRRAAIKIRRLSLIRCPQCGELKLPHRACSACGAYGPVK